MGNSSPVVSTASGLQFFNSYVVEAIECILNKVDDDKEAALKVALLFYDVGSQCQR